MGAFFWKPEINAGFWQKCCKLWSGDHGTLQVAVNAGQLPNTQNVVPESGQNFTSMLQVVRLGKSIITGCQLRTTLALAEAKPTE